MLWKYWGWLQQTFGTGIAGGGYRMLQGSNRDRAWGAAQLAFRWMSNWERQQPLFRSIQCLWSSCGYFCFWLNVGQCISLLLNAWFMYVICLFQFIDCCRRFHHVFVIVACCWSIKLASWNDHWTQTSLVHDSYHSCPLILICSPNISIRRATRATKAFPGTCPALDQLNVAPLVWPIVTLRTNYWPSTVRMYILYIYI